MPDELSNQPDNADNNADDSSALPIYDADTPEALRRVINQLQQSAAASDQTSEPATDDEDTADAADITLPPETDETDSEVTAEADETDPADHIAKPAEINGHQIVPANNTLATDNESSITPEPTPDTTPWTLQQFFDGEVDLDVELSKRFPSMPMMTSVKFRNLGNQSRRRVATLSTQDGSASLVIDADTENKAVQLSFTYGSMMTLRYSMLNLNDVDRTRWLDLMRRDEGGLAFLWGPTRWQQDYLICIGRKYFTNVYAFSPNQFESAIRISPPAMKKLLDWLDDIWQADDEDEGDDDSPLLTW